MISNNIQPDKETLHTTDPQEHMKGPISSTINSLLTPSDPVEEKGDLATAKTFKEAEGTADAPVYQSSLQTFLENHAEYLMGDLKHNIQEDPDAYIEVLQEGDGLILKWKNKI